MQKTMLFVFIFLFASGLAIAQDTTSAYEDALARIEDARQSESDRLDLSNMGLTELPPEIGQVTTLRRLDLSRNELTELPSEIGQLTNLIQLELQSNQLTNLPPEIGQLRNLQALFVGDNELDDLPRELWRLENLQQLNVANNSLIYISTEIGQLKNLNRLDVSGNYLSGFIPQQVISRGNLAILDYLQGQWEQQQTTRRNIILAIGSIVGLLVALVVGVFLRQGNQRKIKSDEV